MTDQYWCPFDSPTLGPLEVVTCYDFYDCPVLFSARDSCSGLHLVSFADESMPDDDGPITRLWLVVPISPAVLERTEAGDRDLYDAFHDPEGGSGVMVMQVDGEPLATDRRVVMADLEPDLFPYRVMLNDIGGGE